MKRKRYKDDCSIHSVLDQDPITDRDDTEIKKLNVAFIVVYICFQINSKCLLKANCRIHTSFSVNRKDACEQGDLWSI